MTPNPRISVLFFHPFPRRSIAHHALKRALQELPAIQVRDLYELYPDFQMDIDLEKSVLVNSDVVIFQHPIYWYSCPSLMKEWIDTVLEKGWAYGEGGNQLAGKVWLQTITTGGGNDAYGELGYNEFTLPEFLRPFERTARLCGMKPLSPFVVHAAHQMTPEQLDSEVSRYRAFLERLLAGDIPPPYSTRKNQLHPESVSDGRS